MLFVCWKTSTDATTSHAFTSLAAATVPLSGVRGMT
jgi:hypothetical protein